MTASSAELDRDIYEAIAAGAEIQSAVLGVEFRAIDRALQRLRKAGRIYFGGQPRRWRVSATKTCPHCGGTGVIEAEVGK